MLQLTGTQFLHTEKMKNSKASEPEGDVKSLTQD